MFRIAVDIGGTFTDGVIEDSSASTVRVAKCLTTPVDPGEAVTTVIRSLLDKAGCDPDQVDVVLHGTTIVTNTLIERKGARVALVTTQGMRDIIDFGREARYDLYDLRLNLAPPLVAADCRVEIDERMTAEGEPLVALSEEVVSNAIEALATLKPEAIAVSLLHSSVDDTHERALEEAIRNRLPDASVSTSSRTAREIREYERTTTTTANAYVQPRVEHYLRQLTDRLQRLGIEAPLRVMVSSGGFTSAAAAAEVPIALLESGPAGGVLSAALAGRNAGQSNVLAFDMGGTTAKLCVVVEGAPTITNSFETARTHRFRRGSGLPILIPSIDLIEIGAGGGSIATSNSLGLLKVGPESSGSEPGPACYGRGGKSATVTDADLVLGYLDPERFLGGEMRLRPDHAMAALEQLGKTIGLDAITTAQGICEVVNESMAAAARVHVAEKGHDPRRFTLVATGGAGPVHAVEVARRLGIQKVLCPIAVGAGSCLGFLAAPARVDRSWSKPTPVDRVNWAEVEARVDGLKSEALRELQTAGIAPSDVEWTMTAEMRFTGQGAIVVVALPLQPVSPEFGQALLDHFHQQYARLFGGIMPSGMPEIVTWRLNGIGRGERRAFEWAEPVPADRIEPRTTRRIFLFHSRSFADVPVYERYTLPPGTVLQGPLVLEERESTFVVPIRARVEVAADRSIMTEIES